MEELKIYVNEEEKHTHTLAGLDQVAGAKLKLDELFVQWLSLPETSRLIRGMVEDSKAGKPLATPAATLHASAASVLAKNPVLSPVRGRNSSPPPRSPTRSLSPSRTPESKSPSSPSPQHFTFGSPEHSPVRPTAMKFADGSNNNTTTAAGVPAGGASGSPGSAAGADARPRADESVSHRSPAGAGSGAASNNPAIVPGCAASTDVVPVFFRPGEGGRGRGKRLNGEGVADKLPAILEVWRRSQADGGVEAGSRPSGDSAKEDTMEVAGVTVSRRDAMSGLPVEQFAAVAKTLCGFPSFFAAPLFRRVRLLLDPAHASTLERCTAACKAAGTKPAVAVEEDEVSTDGTVSLHLFLQYWKQEMEPYDHFDRFFRLVSRPGSVGIFLRDFMPLLEELLAFHPGLAFLEGTPEFQEKYARTVIARIFYMLDPLARGYIDQRALRRSNLLQAFHTVDMEEDINLVNEYFSYEHFYVLYCKFWELDSDRDFLLTRQDLNRMDNLTHAVLDRVFSQAGRPFTSGSPDKMGYEDFICFLLSEEDKTNEVSLSFWFRVIDLNGDGIITPDEMRHFYTEQMRRMADLNLEVVPFEDVLSQMTDLLQPDKDGEFKLEHFLHPTRIRLTGAFFSILFNLQKFTLFEQRDPVVVKQELNEQGITQWDRYAQFEYMKLAEEEENGGDEADLTMDLEGVGVGDMGGGGFDRMGGDGGWGDA